MLGERDALGVGPVDPVRPRRGRLGCVLVRLRAAVRPEDHHEHLGRPAGQFEGRLDRFGQPLADPVAPDEPVYDDLDGVRLVARQRDL